MISRGQAGLVAYEVTVEVHIAGGLPSFTIVGLPAAAVRESKDRVRAALQNCGLPVPPRRVTAHLGPADVPKEGGRFDLPLALAVLLAEQTRNWATTGLEFVGELALDGELKPVRAALPTVLAARDAGRALIMPAANGAEAALVEDAETYLATHLLEVLEYLNGERVLARPKPGAARATPNIAADLADVRGQAAAKRALTIAAAGAHHMLMIGPPGCGKSMLAERLPELLPPLEREERLAVASIASVAGEQVGLAAGGRRPFRAPHHSASAMAMIGGGARPRPGEISLAHHGVLFLDELPEFPRAALEALREPLEQGVVRIARVRDTVAFPARFQLLAAMNPCPCGYHGDGSERCRCSQTQLQHYRARISGPLLDRFDLHVTLQHVALVNTPCEAAPESSVLRERIARARGRQLARSGSLNARLDGSVLWRTANLPAPARALLQRAANQWQLSARAITRALGVAQTIADLAEAPTVELAHVAEALQLRCLDRPPGAPESAMDRL